MIPRTKEKGYPGFIQGFKSPLEKTFITNYTNLIYDFTKSWNLSNHELLCPICSTSEIGHSMYCYGMTSKSGYIHIFDEESKGIFSDCDSCPFWCNQWEFSGNVYLRDPEGETHELFSCEKCYAIFTEEGGLIGEMVPYISLSAEIPTHEEYDDYENIDNRKSDKKDIILTWHEDYDI